MSGPRIANRMPRYRRANPGRQHLAGEDITPRMQRQYEHVLSSLRDYRREWSDERRKSVAAATVRKMAHSNPAFRLLHRRNPDEEASAEQLAADFHGRPYRDVIDVEEEEVYDTHGAVLGHLQQLDILAEDGHHTYPIEFPYEEGSESNILVVSDPAGNNIEFVGGDQDIPNWQEIAEATEDDKNLVLIGPVEEINYWADKHHLEGPEEQKNGMTYFHKFGEEGGEMPWLVLDRRNRKMLLVSGSYSVQPEGITN